MAKLVVTIDGPAGSGKSTVSKLLAAKLDAAFLDTGAMYRAVTLASLNAGIDLSDTDAVAALMDKTDFQFIPRNSKTIVLIDGADATEQIRSVEVTDNARFVANAPALRARLVEMQRKFAQGVETIVTEGRDQGTVVFPDAGCKFFLTADLAERARRRHLELQSKGQAHSIDTIESSIASRDNSDMSRDTGALKPADDAIEIDTTGLSIEEVVDCLYSKVISEAI